MCKQLFNATTNEYSIEFYPLTFHNNKNATIGFESNGGGAISCTGDIFSVQNCNGRYATPGYCSLKKIYNETAIYGAKLNIDVSTPYHHHQVQEPK